MGKLTARGSRLKAQEAPKQPRKSSLFEAVKKIGLALPDVHLATRWDGGPALKAGGRFMAGLAAHPSAEPGTLIVRYALEEREWLLEDAPETYYVTDYYQTHPVVLVRLARIDRDALLDLLTASRRATLMTFRTSARGRRPRARS